ncbi:MAG: hypothetical protein KA184_04050 [Candidatus Hydrogenedentes bacterium]|nr:hypothetical protein [Candidatus Hydrogenedentota bacterium]
MACGEPRERWIRGTRKAIHVHHSAVPPEGEGTASAMRRLHRRRRRLSPAIKTASAKNAFLACAYSEAPMAKLALCGTGVPLEW